MVSGECDVSWKSPGVRVIEEAIKTCWAKQSKTSRVPHTDLVWAPYPRVSYFLLRYIHSRAIGSIVCSKPKESLGFKLLTVNSPDGLEPSTNRLASGLRVSGLGEYRI